MCLVPGGGGGCLVPGGCLFPGGAWSKGGCLVPREGVSCPGWGVPGGDPSGTATAAGGTHLTRMHSCLKGIFKNRKDQERLSHTAAPHSCGCDVSVGSNKTGLVQTNRFP